MRRKSEFELRMEGKEQKTEREKAQEAIVKSTYVLLIVNNYVHSSFSDSWCI